jgi:hypothetical protein
MKLFTIAVIFAGLAFGQTFQGSLRGRTLDQSGATEPSAKVTITDESTKLSRSTVTNEQGEYVFTAVTPATYSLAVEATGFKKSERKGVEVATHSAVGVDVTLELGQITESVNVVDEAPPLETATASTGQAVTTQQIEDLPSLGRNSFFFAKLAQSVVFANNPIMGRMQDQNANSQVSIAGGPIRTVVERTTRLAADRHGARKSGGDFLRAGWL